MKKRQEQEAPPTVVNDRTISEVLIAKNLPPLREPTEAPPTIVNDSTIAGLLIAKNIKVVPFPDENKRIHYAAYGDVEKALKEIYQNQPCGSLDMLNGVKSARGMIWNLKGGQR